MENRLTKLDEWKSDKKREIDKMNSVKAAEEIYVSVSRCKYCKYHVNKVCMQGEYATPGGCLEGIREYLEKEWVIV